MSVVATIYTRDNCLFAYQLHWKLWADWRFKVYDLSRIETLPKLTEPQGVRILEHQFTKPGVSAFKVSSIPVLSPQGMADRVRTNLQNLIRDQIPRALRKHYHLRSIGSSSRQVIEDYVATELDFDEQASKDVQDGLRWYQIVQFNVDLSQPERRLQATYWYNLHIVLEIEKGREELRGTYLRRIHDTILEVSRNHQYRLSRAAILPDHVDLTLGCPIEAAPSDVALSYMNNIATLYNKQPIFRLGAYVGTFGEDEWEE